MPPQSETAPGSYHMRLQTHTRQNHSPFESPTHSTPRPFMPPTNRLALALSFSHHLCSRSSLAHSLLSYVLRRIPPQIRLLCLAQSPIKTVFRHPAPSTLSSTHWPGQLHPARRPHQFYTTPHPTQPKSPNPQKHCQSAVHPPSSVLCLLSPVFFPIP